jgi:hypothetical protein
MAAIAHKQRGTMEMMVFAIRYEYGAWKEYLHTCTNEEIEAIVDSAMAKAFERFRSGTPDHTDFLAGARYMFNISRGTADRPAEGDIRVLDFQSEERLTTTIDREYVVEYSAATCSGEK